MGIIGMEEKGVGWGGQRGKEGSGVCVCVCEKKTIKEEWE